jgi:hypothetical protein
MTTRYETCTIGAGVRRFTTEAAAIRAADRSRLGAYVVQVRTDVRGYSTHAVTYRTGVAA